MIIIFCKLRARIISNSKKFNFANAKLNNESLEGKNEDKGNDQENIYIICGSPPFSTDLRLVNIQEGSEKKKDEPPDYEFLVNPCFEEDSKQEVETEKDKEKEEVQETNEKLKEDTKENPKTEENK